MNVRFTILLTILVLITSTLGCTHESGFNKPRASATNPPTNYDTERYAALSAIIRDMYIDDRTHLLVIEGADPCPSPQPATAPDAKVEEMRKQEEGYAFQKMTELARETINDFHAREKECRPLTNALDVPINYVLVGSKDLEPLFPKGEFDRGWTRFYAKYPQSSGTIDFSNPGFNRDYTQAVVSTGRWCGGLCGAGYFVLLTKDRGAWKVKTKIETWVS